ncbi:MAG TPA: glycosyltransferase family 1 protein [Acidimicrobiales bacterium]|nr:glycosyltransferase family 1 protein [Acidimicrobiales bacterium]
MRAAVHVGQLLQPVPGGIGRYVRNLLASLPGAGVEAVPFAAGGPPEGVEGYVDLGWPVAPLRYELWHRLRHPRIRIPADVVHATSLAVPPSGRRPLVVTIHDLVFLRQPEHLTPRGVSFHRRGLALARRHADAVVVPTAFGRNDLVSEGFEAERIHVAHHGVHLPADPDPASTAAALERLGVATPFILFVATIEPRKGVVDVVAAHRALRAARPDLGLVLAGPKGWGLAPDLRGPGLVIAGMVGDVELDALYRSAVALALPSRYEGFGLQVVEAMARGCPVVTTDAACLPEIAGGAADLVPVGDVDALTDALARLLDDDDHRSRRAAAGRARAGDFSWEASAASHAGAYRSAVASR